MTLDSTLDPGGDPDFHASYQPCDETTLVRIGGEVDLARRLDLQRLLDAVTGSPAGHVDLDLAQVTYLDSIGVAFLFQLAARLHDKGATLRIIAASPVADKLLQLTGWASLY
jgi:anti-anti-sigma factor